MYSIDLVNSYTTRYHFRHFTSRNSLSSSYNSDVLFYAHLIDYKTEAQILSNLTKGGGLVNDRTKIWRSGDSDLGFLSLGLSTYNRKLFLTNPSLFLVWQLT